MTLSPRAQLPGRAMTARIGIVGMGVLGSAMAGHLAVAGWEVRGYDVVPHRTDRLGEIGGIPCESAIEVAAGSDVVFFSHVEPAFSIIGRSAHHAGAPPRSSRYGGR